MLMESVTKYEKKQWIQNVIFHNYQYTYKDNINEKKLNDFFEFLIKQSEKSQAEAYYLITA